jgi:succinate dehydrogenase flavin-adding protein (antitoxin of CptAB toxin-antitoxin module)
MSRAFRDYYHYVQDNWDNLSEKEKKEFLNLLNKIEEGENVDM